MATLAEAIIRGLLAARPTDNDADPETGTIGRLYIASDTDQIFRDNGTTWDEVQYATPNLDDLGAPTGSVDFNGQAITNIGAPVDANSAVPKVYVDGKRITDLVSPDNNLSMLNYNIVDMADPVEPQDAATKAYVDGRSLDDFGAPGGTVSWNNQRISNLYDPSDPQDAATKAYVDANSGGGGGGGGGGTAIAFSAHLNDVDLTVPHDTATKIPFSHTEFNLGSAFDTTESRFQPDVPGYYVIAASARWQNPDTAEYIILINKSGDQYVRLSNFEGDASTLQTASGSTVVYLNGTTDYIELVALQFSGSDKTIRGLNQCTRLTGVLVGGGGGGASFPAGGTTGQALVKASDADDDVEWATIESGGGGGGGSAEPLFDYTIVGGEAYIDVPIPAGHDFLELCVEAKAATTGAASAMLNMRVNGDVTAGAHIFATSDSGPAAADAAHVLPSNTMAGSNLANSYSTLVLRLNRPSEVGRNKSWQGTTKRGENVFQHGTVAGTWLNTGAITTLRLFFPSDTFAPGGRVTLHDTFVVSGGAAGSSYPDTPGTFGGAFAEEFGGPTLDPAWTTSGTSLTHTLSGELDSNLEVTADAGGNMNLTRVFAPGSDPFRVVAKVRVTGNYGTFCGLTVWSSAEDGTATAGVVVPLGYFHGGGPMSLYLWAENYGSQLGGVSLEGGKPIYLSIERTDADSYLTSWSFDGVCWNYFNETVNAATIAKVGLRIYASAPNARAKVLVDWIRASIG